MPDLYSYQNTTEAIRPTAQQPCEKSQPTQQFQSPTMTKLPLIARDNQEHIARSLLEIKAHDVHTTLDY